MALAKGVTVGTRVKVAVGVRLGVGLEVGVRVGLGVRVLVGVLLGPGGRLVGGTTVTTRVLPAVVVSTTTTIGASAVPTLVGVGSRFTVFSGGPKSQAASAKIAQNAADNPEHSAWPRPI